MIVRDGMSSEVLIVGPAHTLRQAAAKMAARHVGAAVVHDPDSDGLGIITERDVLEAVAAGQDADTELVGDHLTRDLVFAAADWPLERAATTMIEGGFRHLVVCEHHDVIGILAMRDIVRCWTRETAVA